MVQIAVLMFHAVGIGEGEGRDCGDEQRGDESCAEHAGEAAVLIAEAEEDGGECLSQPEHGGVRGHDGSAGIGRGGEGNVSGAAGIERAGAESHEKEGGHGFDEAGAEEQEQHGEAQFEAADKAYRAGGKMLHAPLGGHGAHEHAHGVQGEEHPPHDREKGGSSCPRAGKDADTRPRK